MQLFEIENKKEFMKQLLKTDLFNTFEVREVVLHSSFKSVFDGKRNIDFFDSDERQEQTVSEFITWQEMQPYIYTFMSGKKLPTYFKIVLATNPQKSEAISPLASTFFLNVTFKDNKISCSTGVAYKEFSLDKTPEQIWDERIKQFLFKYDFL